MIYNNFDIWKILGVVSIFLLIIFWRKRNAVWGGLTLGIILGFLIALFFVFRGGGFNWYIIGKSAISGTTIGFVAEMLGKLSDLMRSRK